MDLRSLGTLDVQDGRLQDAPERRGLFGLALLAPFELFDLVAQVIVQFASKLQHLDAATLENALAVPVVRQRVQAGVRASGTRDAWRRPRDRQW